MTSALWTRWTRKELALILVIVIFVGAVVFVSAVLARPKPISSAGFGGAGFGDASLGGTGLGDPGLGREWQCSKTLFLTTCTKIIRDAAVPHGAHKDAKCLRKA